MSTWHIVLTKKRQEALAREHLERQGFRAYLPMIKTSMLRRGKQVEATEVLFPRHVFVEMDLERQDVSLIRSTFGAVGLVQYGAEPASVPTDLIEALIAFDHQGASAGPQAAKPLAEPSRRLDPELLNKAQSMLKAPDADQRVMLFMATISKIKR